MEDKTREEKLAEIWKRLVDAAKDVSETGRKVTIAEAGEYGKLLDGYIHLLSGENSFRGRASWVPMNETSYKRIVRQIENETIDSLRGDGATRICYKIAKLFTSICM